MAEEATLDFTVAASPSGIINIAYFQRFVNGFIMPLPLTMFYESHVGKCYADDSTGLYGQSAVHVFSLFYDEISDGNDG